MKIVKTHNFILLKQIINRSIQMKKNNTFLYVRKKHRIFIFPTKFFNFFEIFDFNGFFKI